MLKIFFLSALIFLIAAGGELTSQTTGRYNCEYMNEITKTWTADDWKRNAAEWEPEHWTQYFDCLETKFSALSDKANDLNTRFSGNIQRLETENGEFEETKKMVKDPDLKKQIEQVIEFNSDSVRTYKNNLERLDEVRKNAEYELLAAQICRSHQKLAEQLVAINNKIYENEDYCKSEEALQSLDDLYSSSDEIIFYYTKVKEISDSFLPNDEQIQKDINLLNVLNNEIEMYQEALTGIDTVDNIDDYLDELIKKYKPRNFKVAYCGTAGFEEYQNPRINKLGIINTINMVKKEKVDTMFRILKSIFARSSIYELLSNVADDVSVTLDVILDKNYIRDY